MGDYEVDLEAKVDMLTYIRKDIVKQINKWGGKTGEIDYDMWRYAEHLGHEAWLAKYEAEEAHRIAAEKTSLEAKEKLNKRLINAVNAGNLAIVKKCIESGADINVKTVNDDRIIHAAVTAGHAEMVGYLASIGLADIINSKKMTALMVAAKEGKSEIVDILVNSKAKVGAQDINGQTALMYASFYGHKEIVERLLPKSNINQQDEFLYSALFQAIKSNKQDIIELLVANNADIRLQNNKDETPVLYAIGVNNEKGAKFFIRNGIGIDEANSEGHTPLMKAAQVGSVEMVAYLLRSGANAKLKNKDNKDAKFYAMLNNHDDVVAEFESHEENMFLNALIERSGESETALSF